MPLIRKPTTQELEDHFFGSGAFQYGWFTYQRILGDTFPVTLVEIDDFGSILQKKDITEEIFIEGMKKYAEELAYRTFDDLIEDMDAADVDSVLQIIMFGEQRYS